MLFKNNFIKFMVLALIFLPLVFSTGCKNTSKSKTVDILYPNWSEGIAFTHLAKVMLEEKGYNVRITPLEPGPIYASLAKGNKDLFLDAWLPNTHKHYWEKYGNKINKIGESFSGGTTGIVVPEYVDIDSIKEMNKYKEKFDGKIVGIGSGAGVHKNTKKAIEKYDLDFNQITSSGPAMVSSLKKAVENKEWVAVTGWKPHIMWHNFDIKYLEDPKEIYPKDVCAIVSRKEFEKDFPKLAKFFNNFNLTEEQLYSLEKKINNADNELKATEKWYKNHKNEVDQWWNFN